MFSWFSSLLFAGPARNAPNDGINIKATLAKKPLNTTEITQDLVQHTLANLKKTETNADRPPFYRAPLLRELDSVFLSGDVFKAARKKHLKVIAEIDEMILEVKGVGFDDTLCALEPLVSVDGKFKLE